MRRNRAALAVTAMTSMFASRSSATTYTFQGEGTSYSLGEPSGGNCNLMNYPSDATTKYAALNAAQWDSTMNCGRCAQVTCTDALCANAPQSSEIVYIVDQCPGCEDGDLDLSPEVFESITGLSYTRVSVEWSFVDCPVEGSIEYCLKTGSNSFWTAVQPTNMVAGVKSLSINGKATTMVDSAFYFLLDGNSQDKTDLSQVTISMVGVNGEEVQDTVSFTSEECVQGSSQFSTGNPSSDQDYELYMSAASGASASVSTDSPTTTPVPVETPGQTVPPSSPTPTPTPTLTSTSTPVPTDPPTNTPSSTKVAQASSGSTNTTTVAVDADSSSVASSTPSPSSLRVSTASGTDTTPAIIGLGVLLLVGLVILAAVAINARRKKIALRTKQSEIVDDIDRLSTVLSPHSPSASTAYLPVQTPTRNFAVLY